jgi:20S proteasome subunit alpha 6
LDDIIIHGLKALRDSLPADATLTAQNCSFASISKGSPFTLVEDESTIQSYLDKLPPVVARQFTESPSPAEVPIEIIEEIATGEESSAAGDIMDVDPTE